jgi:hypothetical protein
VDHGFRQKRLPFNLPYPFYLYYNRLAARKVNPLDKGKSEITSLLCFEKNNEINPLFFFIKGIPLDDTLL